LRAARGLLATTFPRSNAAGKAKDMPETHARLTETRLTEARGIHEEMAQLARRHGAQHATDNQGEVSKVIGDANAALRGKAVSGPDDFPELENPDIAMSSAGHVHMSATGSTHIASREHTALTTGGNVAIAALKSLYASVRERISFFASKAITVISASGRIYIEARTNKIEAIACDVLALISKQDWVKIAAAKGIELNAGGTMVRIQPNGVTIFTNGQYLVHAASHATDAPQAFPVQLPVTQENPGKLVAHHVLVEDVGGFTLPHQPYRLMLDDGQMIQGLTNEFGELQLATSNAVSFGVIELMSQSAPRNVISVSNTAVWRDGSLPTPAAMANSVRRATRVGGKTAETPVSDTTSQKKPPTFISCDPMNFGLRACRYIDNAKLDAAPVGMPYRHGVEYPVTRVYAAAVRTSLGAINWRALQGKSARETRAIIVNALQDPLWAALQSGPFGLPKDTLDDNKAPRAMPGILIVSSSEALGFGMRTDVTASFVSNQWVMTVYQAHVDKIVSMSNDPYLLDASLRALADTVYHEARHCQQTFWMMSLLKNFPDDYKEFSAIKETYEIYVGSDVLQITKNTPFPDDALVRIGVHRLLIFHYYWLTMDMRNKRGYEFVRVDLEKIEAEVCKLLNIAPDVARRMAQFETGYRSQLHEEDTYACGEVVQAYWDNPATPLVRNPGTCTDQYIDALKIVGAGGNA
jgi:type VI secretion system secreted protein VgrG